MSAKSALDTVGKVFFPGGELTVSDRFRTDNAPTRTTTMTPIDRVVEDLLDAGPGIALASDIEHLRLASRWFRLTCLGIEVSWSCADPTAARLMTVKAPGLKAMSFAAYAEEDRAAMLKRLCSLVERWAGVE